MNLIPDIMKKLGVEEFEVFNLADTDNKTQTHVLGQPIKYFFTSQAMICTELNGYEHTAEGEFIGLIRGVYHIVKLPFKPKKWEIYW